MSYQSTAGLNIESEEGLRAEWGPQQDSALKHIGIHLFQLEAQPGHSHRQVSDLQQLEPHKDVTKFTRLEHNIIEDYDSLKSPNRLENGATLNNLRNELPNTIQKSPSNQELAKWRCETPGRMVSGRSKTGLQIRVPDRQPSRLISKGPLLHDKSTVYIHSSPPSGSERNTNSFGAIGDQRSPQPGPSSAPLVYHSPEQLQVQRSISAGHCQSSPLYDLVNDSNVSHENLELPLVEENISLSPTQSGRNTQGNPRTQGLATAGHLQYPTLQDLVDDSTPDSDQYELVVAGETGSLKQSIVYYRVTSPKLWVRTRRTRSMTNLKEIPMPKPIYTEEPSAISVSSQIPATFNTPASNSPLSVDSTSKSESTTAPVWRRNGPPFASSIRPIVTLHQRAQFGNSLPRPVPEEMNPNEHVAFLDKLDPEEFCLPNGSIVYSMKSNNITNLQISITKSIWTSTLGSNIVLTEAWERKKPEEKIVLLFSITHSVKHSGKYLGMAEMVGPLDLQANCEFWTERKNGTQGLIPVRWIVIKDVPFSRFQDLKYHEQNITQVRHGNTIPGEVGRLVIQRYFESTHGPTAALHPLSQSFQNAEVPWTQSTQSPAAGRNEKWISVPRQHEVPRGGLATFRRGRGRLRGAGSVARWSQKGSSHLIDTFAVAANFNPKGQPQPALRSFRRIVRPRDTLPPYGQPMIQGPLDSTFEGPLISGRRGFQGIRTGNSYGNLLQTGERQPGQPMGPKQQIERDNGK